MLLISRQLESDRWCNVHIECEIGQLFQELKKGGGGAKTGGYHNTFAS
jgi:hypothetical protein